MHWLQGVRLWVTHKCDTWLPLGDVNAMIAFALQTSSHPSTIFQCQCLGKAKYSTASAAMAADRLPTIAIIRRTLPQTLL
ncbi:hypothetical protein N7537_011429 [Penicillium hordei]|uniref:Uncharacterized protein n=1 Tax=Penicillium hordei TaxID=40994 RepID=A0AAD6GRR4_9EURO|nr:uncharacterized protein N7537_011429 [Penicillium hordei]KAJ5588751.1 hypothetical protein N7537_011429 [Penicillium hordei]